jgi:hypothetical protein
MNPIVFRPAGLTCPPGDFCVDPARPSPRAVSPRAHVRRARKFPAWRHQRRLISLVMALLVTAGENVVRAEEITPNSATALAAKYAELGGKLEASPFKKPLYLESSDAKGELKANVYALLRHPFPAVRSALNEPAHWCDILILHLNTKYCRASAGSAATVLKVNIGRKSDQPIEQSYRVEFSYRVIEAGPDHLAVVLNADKGPFGTRNYRILLEAVPL